MTGSSQKGPHKSCPGQPQLAEALPKTQSRNIFKKRKKALKTRQGTSVCAASISCMRFLYSIFLAIVVSLFAEGWERPSVSGTHLLSYRHSVPCVPCFTPPTATSMFLWLMGCTRPAGRCPLTAFPQLQPPGGDICMPVWLPWLIFVSCRAMTWPPMVPPW